MEDGRSAAAAVCGGVGGYGLEAAPRLPLRSSPGAFTAKGAITTASRVFLSGQGKNFGREERKFIYLHLLYFVSLFFYAYADS